MRALILSLLALPLPAFAVCDGPSLIDDLSAEQTARLEAMAAIPYAEATAWLASRGEDRMLVVGTMHLPDDRHDGAVETLAEVIAASDVLLVEATEEDMGRLMMAAAGPDRDRFFLPEGQSLIDLMGKDWPALASAAAERGVPGFMLAPMRPWFAYMSLAMPACAMAAAQAGDLGIDMRLMAAAAEAGVPVRAVEPWDTVFRLLDIADATDAEMALDALRQIGRDGPLMEATFTAMMDAYFAGEAGVMMVIDDLMVDFLPADEQAAARAQIDLFDRHLIDERNAAWLPVIESETADPDRIVVAVGAAHLPGESGVLEGLAEAGWTLAPWDGGAPEGWVD